MENGYKDWKIFCNYDLREEFVRNLIDIDKKGDRTMWNITVPDYKPEKRWPIHPVRYLFTLVKRLIEIDADNDASSVGSKLDGVLKLH